jgi:hypothetical protein
VVEPRPYVTGQEPVKDITETNRIQLALFGIQIRTLVGSLRDGPRKHGTGTPLTSACRHACRRARERALPARERFLREFLEARASLSLHVTDIARTTRKLQI